jgi:N-acyl homoserine lactone hydrolase
MINSVSGGVAAPGYVKRMWALDGAKFTVNKSELVVGGPNELVTIPTPAFLIEHPKGLVLFDTGMAPLAATDPEGVYGHLAAMLNMTFTPEQTVDAQLTALGYKCEDVRYVVASHLHFDHTGGLYLFPNAEFFVGPGELRYAFWPDTPTKSYFRYEDIQPARDFKWREIPGIDHDVFGDGSLVILFTPGHTPGELSLLVRTPGRNFVLTGDTVHIRSALETVSPMYVDTHPAESIRSIQRLQLIRDSADATIWINHDADDWAEFKHAPFCFE